jgi:hypothetical protein
MNYFGKLNWQASSEEAEPRTLTIRKKQALDAADSRVTMSRGRASLED